MSEARRYPRTARINEVLREVIADALEREVDRDERLELVTITGVEAEPDLRHARVFYSALGKDVTDALTRARVHLQSAIAGQARLKRTPQLSFMPDPSIDAGFRVETILASLERDDDQQERGQDDHE